LYLKFTELLVAVDNARGISSYTQRAADGPQLAPHKCHPVAMVLDSPSSQATSSWVSLPANPGPARRPTQISSMSDPVRGSSRCPSRRPWLTRSGTAPKTAKTRDRVVKLCTGQTTCHRSAVVTEQQCVVQCRKYVAVAGLGSPLAEHYLTGTHYCRQ